MSLGVLTPETKSKEKNSKKHKRKSSDSDSSSSSSISQDKRVKTEEVTSQLVRGADETTSVFLPSALQSCDELKGFCSLIRSMWTKICCRTTSRPSQMDPPNAPVSSYSIIGLLACMKWTHWKLISVLPSHIFRHYYTCALTFTHKNTHINT